MRIAITSNGPGEFAGWVRPLVRSLYERDPQLDVTLFFVPDEYATGREASVAQAMFPALRVIEPRRYTRFALGASADGFPEHADLVLYLGGDLLHAVRVHKRLGGRARAYKFARPRYRNVFERFYAVDAANEAQLTGWGVERTRIETVGNLAVDAAFAESVAVVAGDELEPSSLDGGVLIMPGARRHEITNLVPFFLEVAVWLRRFDPRVPVAFGLSPFTTMEQVEHALAHGGDPRFWGARGRVENDHIVPEMNGERFPIVRQSMRYATRAGVALTIPGTKCIELAALGIPSVVCAPLNAPELVVINGPLTYLDRLPLLGPTLKRSVTLAVARRFHFLAQPNIDAGEALMPELRGALMPAHVAHVTLDYLQNAAVRQRAAAALRLLYRAHAGAAARMSASLVLA